MTPRTKAEVLMPLFYIPVQTVTHDGSGDVLRPDCARYYDERDLRRIFGDECFERLRRRGFIVEHAGVWYVDREPGAKLEADDDP